MVSTGTRRCFVPNQPITPPRGYVHEAVVPLIVHVDVGHVTDEAALRVEDAPLAQFALRGTRVLGELQLGELHRISLLLGGKKGALLTALNYNSAVRSHQAVSMRPVLRYLKRRGRRDPSPVCQV
jgi:hypothetical protein